MAYPLVITVTRQEVVKPSGGGLGADQQVVAVPIGSADIDLSPLLMNRPGNKQPANRSVPDKAMDTMHMSCEYARMFMLSLGVRFC